MPDAERIKRRLDTLREAGNASQSPKRVECVASPCQNFMRVSLVPDVPDEFVASEIEHRIKCQRQLDRAQARRKMPAVVRDRRQD